MLCRRPTVHGGKYKIGQNSAKAAPFGASLNFSSKKFFFFFCNKELGNQPTAEKRGLRHPGPHRAAGPPAARLGLCPEAPDLAPREGARLQRQGGPGHARTLAWWAGGGTEQPLALRARTAIKRPGSAPD